MCLLRTKIKENGGCVLELSKSRSSEMFDFSKHCLSGPAWVFSWERFSRNCLHVPRPLSGWGPMEQGWVGVVPGEFAPPLVHKMRVGAPIFTSFPYSTWLKGPFPVISLFFQWIHLQNELSLSRYCSSLALLGQSGHPQSRFLPMFYILIYTFPLPFPTFTAAVVIKSCLFRTFLLS